MSETVAYDELRPAGFLLVRAGAGCATDRRCLPVA